MNLSDPDLVVVVEMITYNHGKYIAQAIESVINQRTSFKYKLIIFDDCSTDITQEICRTYKAQYPELIELQLNEKNIGVRENAKLLHDASFGSSAKYIAMLDGDDYWTDNKKLQMQVDLLEKDPTVSICFTRVGYFNDNTQEPVANWLLPFITKERFAFTDILKVNIITTCSVVFRNALPSFPASFYDFPFTDWPIFLFLLTKGDAVYIDKLTGMYRLHNNGAFSALQKKNQNLMTLKIYEGLLNYPELSKYHNLVKRYLSERAYIAYCYEIKKQYPDRSLSRTLMKTGVKQLAGNNIYFPMKLLLRNALYSLTGKSFGKESNAV